VDELLTIERVKLCDAGRHNTAALEATASVRSTSAQPLNRTELNAAIRLCYCLCNRKSTRNSGPSVPLIRPSLRYRYELWLFLTFTLTAVPHVYGPTSTTYTRPGRAGTGRAWHVGTLASVRQDVHCVSVCQRCCTYSYYELFWVVQTFFFSQSFRVQTLSPLPQATWSNFIL